VPLADIRSEAERQAVLEHSNWAREQGGLLIFRLTPERALMLFGDHTDRLAAAMAESSVNTTSKYRLIGNMIAPEVVRHVAATIDRVLFFRPQSLVDNDAKSRGIAQSSDTLF